MDIDYRHIVSTLLLIGFVIFYLKRHFNSDVKYISKVLSQLLHMENINADAGDMAGDLQTVAAAKRVSDEQKHQKEVDESFIAEQQGKMQVDVYNAFTEINNDIYARFKEIFIELNISSDVKPHMLSMGDIADYRCVAGELGDHKHASSVWLLDERKLFLRYDHFALVQLEITVAFDKVSCELHWFNSPSIDFDFVSETESVIDTLTLMSESYRHDNNGNVFWGTVEELVYNRGVRSDEDFLLGFSNRDNSRYFVNPMAFGQAMVEGNFTVDDFNAADVHHHFTISEEHPDQDHVTFNVDLRAYANFRDGSFATSSAKSIHDVPPMFHQLGLIEYMFYWYQLGIVMRTMFVRKNPELLITLHDNVWSNS